MANPVHLKNW